MIELLSACLFNEWAKQTESVDVAKDGRMSLLAEDRVKYNVRKTKGEHTFQVLADMPQGTLRLEFPVIHYEFFNVPETTTAVSACSTSNEHLLKMEAKVWGK